MGTVTADSVGIMIGHIKIGETLCAFVTASATVAEDPRRRPANGADGESLATNGLNGALSCNESGISGSYAGLNRELHCLPGCHPFTPQILAESSSIC